MFKSDVTPKQTNYDCMNPAHDALPVESLWGISAAATSSLSDLWTLDLMLDLWEILFEEKLETESSIYCCEKSPK